MMVFTLNAYKRKIITYDVIPCTYQKTKMFLILSSTFLICSRRNIGKYHQFSVEIISLGNYYYKLTN